MHLNELQYHAADLVRMLPEQTLARMAASTKVSSTEQRVSGFAIHIVYRIKNPNTQCNRIE